VNEGVLTMAMMARWIDKRIKVVKEEMMGIK
jgi:hypothetical protein